MRFQKKNICPSEELAKWCFRDEVVTDAHSEDDDVDGDALDHEQLDTKAYYQREVKGHAGSHVRR